MVSLEEVVGVEKKSLERGLSRVTVNNLQAVTVDFWLKHEKFGIYELSRLKFNNAKEHFYLCGRLDEITISKFNDSLFQYGFRHVCYVLLSDCTELIKRYSNLKYVDDRNNRSFEKSVEEGESDIFCHSMIMASVGNMEMLKRNINIMITKTFTLEKNQGILELDLEFFKALHNKNKNDIESVINEMLLPKNHKKRNDSSLLSQYLSLPAAGYAKLAWINNIEVVINNPLVPQECLPLKPLQQYDDKYDFFNW